MTEKVIRGKTLRLVQGDITDLDVESFVFYARPDLKLGTGFGGAIAQRGGPSIQAELNGLGPLEPGEAVVTQAGNLKAKRIIHAVGPRHHEPDEEAKLRKAVRSALAAAEAAGLKQVAFPAMGAGFYGVSLDLSSKVVVEEIAAHLGNESRLSEVVVCVLDQRELKPFGARVGALG
ncbi:MAG: macro domain-containing protein [Acidobacteriota bacterium]